MAMGLGIRWSSYYNYFFIILIQSICLSPFQRTTGKPKVVTVTDDDQTAVEERDWTTQMRPNLHGWDPQCNVATSH